MSTFQLSNPVFNGKNADKLNKCKAKSADAAAYTLYENLKNMIKNDERVLLFSVTGGKKNQVTHYTGVTKGGKSYCKAYTPGTKISRVTKELDSNNELKTGGNYYMSPFFPTDPYYYNYSLVYDPFVYNWAPYASYIFDHHLWLYNGYYPYAPFYNSLVPNGTKKNGSK